MSGTNSRGERPAWESHKAPSRAKDLSQTTVLEGITFRAFKCSLLRVGQLPPEWHRLVPDQGRISPETVSFTRAEFGELQYSVSKILAVHSDLDWWVAGVSNLAKDIQLHLSHDENLQLAGTYSPRYLLESCRSLEELKIQVTALFSHIKLSGLRRCRVHSLWLLVDHYVLRNWYRILVRAVKGLISRAGMVSICPLLWQRDVKLQQTHQTEREGPNGHEKRLESEPTCRGVYFWRGAGVPGGEQATGRCLPEVQHYYVGHISQKEPGPQGPGSSSSA